MNADLPVDITYHDSNEEPETDCKNKVISFKFNDVIYQYFNQSEESAFDKFKTMIKAMVALSPVKLPETVFCVVTKFNSQFFVDWAVIERHYKYQQAKLSVEE